MPSNPIPPSDPSNLASTWLERFLAVYPDGGLAEFYTWAGDQAELVDSQALRAQTRKQLESRLGAGELPAAGFESGSGSVFGRGGKRRERKPTAAPGGEALQPGRVIGSFTLTRFIASGGMGQVWEAEDAELRRKVALKLVLPDRIEERSLEMFAREARAGGRLSHPNLVTTLAYGTNDGLSWIAQELVEGSWTVKDSLDALRSEDTVPKGYYREVAELVAKVADGMQAVHDAGVIHRDLKPQNILVASDDTPKVTDFGLARVSDDSFLSQEGDFAGTWAYMSPEQVTAKRMGLDHRTDIFSLGVVLYELLTLRRPFEGDTTHQIAQEIVYAEPPDATKVRSQCPHELAVIAGKALEKLSGDRYSSMAELAADLRRHLADEPILAKPPGPLVRGMKWVRRHPAIGSAGAIASVALVVVSGLTLNLARQTELATESAQLAEQRAEENAELARIATDRANDILSLSATKDLEDLVTKAETLWPAHPEMIPRYERWLADAQVLIDGRPADESAGIKARPSLADHEAKLTELLARSVPQADEERLAQAREHESNPELEGARAELIWRKRMLGQEEWLDASEVEQAVEREELPSEPSELLALARSLVGPGAEGLGQVTRGWVLAGRALDANAGEDAEGFHPLAMMTMAWAETRRGNGGAALGAMEEAIAEQEAADGLAREEAAAAGEDSSGANSTADGEGNAEDEQQDPQGKASEDSDALRALKEEAVALEGFVARWEGAALADREAELPELEARITALEIWVGERVFADPQDGWWQRQLAALVAGIEALHDPETGLARNTLAEPFGWGVAKRAEFARGIEERSVTGKDSVERWKDAFAAIEASEHYDGLRISSQMGLQPIGMDPESGLWEFAHLQTGDPAVRGEDGKLVLAEDTGLVFVLIPGGTFLMGAQADPDGDNYDPEAQSDEGPVHPVTLSPYFLSKYEMTQGQWKRSTAVNPSAYGPDGGWNSPWSRGNPESSLLHPVEQVAWTECMALMGRLELELPSEAQWGNGCRARTSSVYWSGDELEVLEGVGNITDQYAFNNGAAAWANHEAIDDGNTVHGRVGSYRANAFGLHDVHGNVLEWCRDGYESGAYAAEGRTDPVVSWTGSAYRVSRGGNFNNPARNARSAFRFNSAPEYRDYGLGLRPAKGITADNFTPDRAIQHASAVVAQGPEEGTLAVFAVTSDLEVDNKTTRKGSNDGGVWELKDILRMLNKGVITEGGAEDIMEEATEAFHSGRSGVEMRTALTLSEPEYRAYVFGVPFLCISSWRYGGWPQLCGKCAQPLLSEGGWFPWASAGERWTLIHPDCIE